MAGAIVLTLVVIAAVLLLLTASVRLVQQYQRGIVFRFGRVLDRVRQPGLRFIIPVADRMVKVSMQTTVIGVPAQGAITRDNVTLTVDAVVYYRVVDPIKVLVNVRDYPSAVLQVAQTSLRSVIGRFDLDTLLSDRERVNAELKAVIDAPTEKPWGLLIERVEVKDVSLPDAMKRSMSRQAEAERERRARVIAADGEFQASRRLADASQAMADTPGAFQLRLLQTVVDVAAEKNSTLVMPFPVELLRFFDRASRAGGEKPPEWAAADGRPQATAPTE
jgi:regulator of protease activity HflC (stomatin/prohibitin superfamily)